MLAIIDAIGKARLSRRGNKTSQNMLTRRFELHSRMTTLEQRLESDRECAEHDDQILATAELYRIAGLLYLFRVLPLPGDENERTVYVSAAFRVLGNMPICTSPWPLFTIACEAGTDEQRMLILEILDRMDETRNIGNVFCLRNIIEVIWKQTDLRSAASVAEQAQWWQMLGLKTAVPWFI